MCTVVSSVCELPALLEYSQSLFKTINAGMMTTTESEPHTGIAQLVKPLAVFVPSISQLELKLFIHLLFTSTHQPMQTVSVSSVSMLK